MGIIRNGIEAGGAIAYDYANVTNIRKDVYKAKAESSFCRRCSSKEYLGKSRRIVY